VGGLQSIAPFDDHLNRHLNHASTAMGRGNRIAVPKSSASALIERRAGRLWCSPANRFPLSHHGRAAPCHRRHRV